MQILPRPPRHPEDYKLNYIIAIGYPDEKPDAKPRDESKVKYIK